MASIDRVAAVYIGDHGISDFRRALLFIPVDLLEVFLLVRASMGAEDGGTVCVVCVCSASAGVVCWKAQDIEVLESRDDGVFFEIVPEDRGRELAFNEFPGDSKRVVLVQVEPASDVRLDCAGDVCPFVGWVGFVLDFYFFYGSLRLVASTFGLDVSESCG